MTDDMVDINRSLSISFKILHMEVCSLKKIVGSQDIYYIRIAILLSP